MYSKYGTEIQNEDKICLDYLKNVSLKLTSKCNITN